MMKFLEYIVGDLYGKYPDRMQDLTLVLPTRRAGLFVKDYLGRLVAGRPVCAPQCTTITDLFDSLCPLKPADEVQAVCMLYNIYNNKVGDLFVKAGDMGGPLTLDAFYGWGRQLIADFNNIEKGANDSLPMDILRSSKEALHFSESNIDPEVRARIEDLLLGERQASAAETDDSFRMKYEALWRKLPDIYQALTEALQKDGYALEGARCRWVVEHFAEVMPQIQERKFVFAGFNKLLAVERKLITQLRETDAAIIYNEPAVTGEEAWSEFQIPDPIDIVAAPSDNAQARYVHKWLLDHHRPGQRTAVVLCNETQLSHVVHSIPPQFADEVNITKGYPMRNTRIYADICRHLHAHKDDKADFADTLRKLLKLCTPSCEGGDAYTWHDLLNIESAYQARLVIVRFIQLVTDGPLGEVTTFHTLRNLLLHHLATVSIPFHGEPITDIQIIGVLETRALDFDNILFLNVEEGVLPKLGKDNSFIPYYLRKYYGLPTNDDQTEIYAYNFFRLLKRATHVTILYCDAQTATGQRGMSPFVMQMLVSPHLPTRHLQLTDHATLPPVAEEADTVNRLLSQSQYKSYAQRLLANEMADGEASLSPSALKTFLTCRMKFFIRYMLGLPEPETTDVLLQANEIGTLIHNSAEVAYKNITRNYTVPLTPEAIKAFRTNPVCIAKAVGEAFRMLNDDYRKHNPSETDDHYDPAKHQVEIRVAGRHLAKILENDENTPGLDIVSCERNAYYKTHVGDLNLKIGGRIDRIDKIGDRYRIVDYKTGRYDEKNMKIDTLDQLFEEGKTEKGNFLQTLIYCLAATHDTADLIPQGAPYHPALIYTQKKLDKFDPRLYIANGPLLDFTDIREEFETRLLELIDTVLHTESFPMLAAADPNNSPCKYCKYRELCGR